MTFYEAKGMVRYTFILSKAHKAKLVEIAKKNKISQIDVISALIEYTNFDDPVLQGHFAAVASGGRPGRTLSLAKRLKALPPEKLAEIEKLIGTPT